MTADEHAYERTENQRVVAACYSACAQLEAIAREQHADEQQLQRPDPIIESARVLAALHQQCPAL